LPSHFHQFIATKFPVSIFVKLHRHLNEIFRRMHRRMRGWAAWSTLASRWWTVRLPRWFRGLSPYKGIAQAESGQSQYATFHVC
jgi:hypothetical protein